MKRKEWRQNVGATPLDEDSLSFCISLLHIMLRDIALLFSNVLIYYNISRNFACVSVTDELILIIGAWWSIFLPYTDILFVHQHY